MKNIRQIIVGIVAIALFILGFFLVKQTILAQPNCIQCQQSQPGANVQPGRYGIASTTVHAGIFGAY